jgi:hypothetical protein
VVDAEKAGVNGSQAVAGVDDDLGSLPASRRRRRDRKGAERNEQHSHGGDRPPTWIRPLCGVFTPHSRPRRPYTPPAAANVPKDTMLTSAPPISVPYS